MSTDRTPQMRRTALSIMDYCASTPAMDWSVSKICDLISDGLAARASVEAESSCLNNPKTRSAERAALET